MPEKMKVGDLVWIKCVDSMLAQDKFFKDKLHTVQKITDFVGAKSTSIYVEGSNKKESDYFIKGEYELVPEELKGESEETIKLYFAL